MAQPFAYYPKLAPGRYALPIDEIRDFAQPSVTTYVNEAGAVVLSPINTPRYEAGDLLIEAASRNLFASPDNLGALDWAISGSGIGFAAPNDTSARAPDMSFAALKLQAGTVQLSQTVAAVAGGIYTPSLWVRYPTGGDATIQVQCGSATATKTVGASTSWRRISLDPLTNVSANPLALIRLTMPAAIWVWGAQLEPGPAVTSLMLGARGDDTAYLNEGDMQPLRQSHEADELEAELKALFIKMAGVFVRPGERTVNTLGIPHAGPFTQVERAVSAEGLSLLRNGDETTMRYVFKSWRARNPKRGLAMLKTYLQLLWPNGWEMTQQWAKNGATYPLVLEDADGGDHYLTSRIKVQVSTGVTNGSDVASIAPSLRSVIPARMVLKVQVITQNQIDMGILMGGRGLTFQEVTGTFI